MEVQPRESAARAETTKDTISVHGYESILKKNLGAAANFGIMNTLSLKIAYTSQTILSEQNKRGRTKKYAQNVHLPQKIFN